MVMLFTQKKSTAKPHTNFWWLRWCLGIYSESVLERFKHLSHY